MGNFSSDLAKKITLGPAFRISNRKLNRVWTGHFVSICRQLDAEGFNKSKMWRGPDSEVGITRVFGSLRAVYGEDIFIRISGVRSKINALQSSSTVAVQSELAAALGSLTPLELSVFVRLVAAGGDLDVVRQVHRNIATILDSEDKYGMTPVAWACAFGQEKVVRYAIGCGLDLNHENNLSWTYTDLAVDNHHDQLVAELISKGAVGPGSIRQKMESLQ